MRAGSNGVCMVRPKGRPGWGGVEAAAAVELLRMGGERGGVSEGMMGMGEGRRAADC